MNLYAVYNKHCGHVLGVHPDRAVHEPMVEALQPVNRHALRTRVATDADIEAVVRGIRCEKCSLDGVVTRPEGESA